MHCAPSAVGLFCVCLESTPVTFGARERLLQALPQLSPQLQTAARFVVDHPHEVLIRSMRSVAEHAGLPPSTLVRLARQTGYDNWGQLKDDFAQEAGLGRPQGYAQRAQQLHQQNRPDNLIHTLFGTTHTNLQRTQQHSHATLAPIAQCLQNAQQVYVAGFRASYPLAFALLYGYRLFRDSVHLVDAHAHSLEMQLRPLGPQDVVVTISFSPYSRECLQVAQTARQRGAQVVALTDSATSPLVPYAQHVGIFSTDSPSFFPSITAGMALIEALLAQLLVQGDAQLPARLHSAEHTLHTSGAYVHGTARAPRKPSV